MVNKLTVENNKSKKSLTLISNEEPPQLNKTEYIKPKQSANTLFHFMKELDYLKMLLSMKKIVPRYCTEDFSFLDKGLPKLIMPMKCFCDIYLNKLVDHRNLYGSYGIGFDKEWLVNQGIQPIQYVNP